MFKTILFILALQSANSYGQIASNVILVDSTAYVIQVIQTLMNEIEAEGWYTLTVPDFSQVIDQTIYGYKVNGTINYKNGFVKSIGAIDVTQSSVDQTWLHSTSTGVSSVNLGALLNLREVTLVYDVEFVDQDGEKHFYVATYTYELISINFYITYRPQLEEITTDVLRNTVSAGPRRLSFLPVDKLNQVLSRTFTAGSLAVSNWIDKTFAPKFEHVVKAVIPFPELCYNCSL